MTVAAKRDPPLLPLRLVDVTYEAGSRRIIDRVTLTLDHGPRTVLLGPNGAGKSVLLRLCHGLLRATSGQVRFAGPESEGRRRRHAMVFQHPVMLRRSAFANVAYALAVAGIAAPARQRLAAEAMERVGLNGVASRPARVLSGGERQRLAIARAWALRPELLLLDEPTANLDPSATQSIEAAIQAVHEAGTKIVMITHNLGQAHRMGDEAVFLSGGRLVEHAPMSRFLQSPASPEAAAFLKGELPWT
jgi:tungstate transport system ATP-binding protein